MVSIEYRNIMELIFEDLLTSGKLDIMESDSIDTIEDAACATLGKMRPIYIKNHVDFFYSVSVDELDTLRSQIMDRFNIYIELFRNQQGELKWQD